MYLVQYINVSFARCSQKCSQMGCACSCEVGPPLARKELQAASELHIGPELTLDQLIVLRDEQLLPALEQHGYLAARGQLEELITVVRARADEVEVHLAAKTGSFIFSPMLAILDKELQLSGGTTADALSQSCVSLGLRPEGSLVAQASACVVAVCGQPPAHEANKCTEAEVKQFASDLLLAAHAPFNAGTPLGQLAALRKQKLEQVLKQAERLKILMDDPVLPHVGRRLTAVRERMLQLDVLIHTKQRYAPIPLMTCHFATVRPATIAALATPHDLPQELELLAVLRGEAHQRVPCGACAGQVRQRRVSSKADARQASRSAFKAVWCFESSLQVIAC